MGKWSDGRVSLLTPTRRKDQQEWLVSLKENLGSDEKVIEYLMEHIPDDEDQILNYISNLGTVINLTSKSKQIKKNLNKLKNLFYYFIFKALRVNGGMERVIEELTNLKNKLNGEG